MNHTASDLQRVSEYIRTYELKEKERSERLKQRLKEFNKKVNEGSLVEKLCQIVRIGQPTLNKGAAFPEWPLKKSDESIFEIVTVSAEESRKQELSLDNDAEIEAIEGVKWSKPPNENLEDYGKLSIQAVLPDGMVVCKYDDIQLLSGTAGYLKYKAGKVIEVKIVAMA